MLLPFDLDARRLGAYGKLPSARDFVQFGTQAPGFLEVRGMIDAAASWMIAARDRGVNELRFACSGRQRGGLAVGSLWPSNDQGGLRAFPFALTHALDGPASLDGAFAALEPLHALQRELFVACREATDLAEVSAHLDDSGRRALPAVQPRRIVGRGIDAWIRRVFGNADEALMLGLWRLHLLARAARGRLAGMLPERRGFVLPLDPSATAGEQADLWLRLLRCVFSDADRVDALIGGAEWPYLVVCGAPLDGGEFAAAAGSEDPRLVRLDAARVPADRAGLAAFQRGVRVALDSAREVPEALGRLIATGPSAAPDLGKGIARTS